MNAPDPRDPDDARDEADASILCRALDCLMPYWCKFRNDAEAGDAEAVDLAARTERIMDALRRRTKTITSRMATRRGPPAEPPSEPMVEGFVWETWNFEANPPVPPPGMRWSVSIGGKWGPVSYELVGDDAITPELLAEDDLVIERWGTHVGWPEPLPPERQ